jgi:hypothetical protein
MIGRAFQNGELQNGALQYDDYRRLTKTVSPITRAKPGPLREFIGF